MSDNTDRKRSLDSADTSSSSQMKRLKPEDITGGNTEDNRVGISRMLVNKLQFSKIIGKGGQTVNNIRANFQITMKCTEINEEERVIVLSGPPLRVISAFDAISEILTLPLPNSAPTSPLDIFKFEFLVEPSKIGRVIGAKGQTISNLKPNCGLQQLQVIREPRDVGGVSLRVINLEGNILAVRRFHYALIELFCDPSTLMVGGNNNTGYSSQGQGQGMSSMPMSMSMMSNPNPNPGNRNGQMMSSQDPNLRAMQSSYNMNVNAMPMGSHMNMHMNPVSMPNTAAPAPVVVPFDNLVSYGILPSTVQQLSDMRSYLLVHFGLELSIISKKGDDPSLPPAPLPPSANPHANPNPNPSPQVELSNEHQLQFLIPCQAGGAVIGEKGALLRELQQEFCVSVYVEKAADAMQPTRLVTIKRLNSGGSGYNTQGQGQEGVPLLNQAAALACKNKILAVVEKMMMQLQAGGNSK